MANIVFFSCFLYYKTYLARNLLWFKFGEVAETDKLYAEQLRRLSLKYNVLVGMFIG